MKKHLLQIGKAIDKDAQKAINGGGGGNCFSTDDCYDYTTEDDGSGCWHVYACQQSRCVLLDYTCG
ncbi:MAG: hypothetical protein AAFQ94_06690 [Bacteroidota bacterium]